MKVLSPMAMMAIVAAMSVAALASDVTNSVSSAKSTRKRVMRRDAGKIEEATPAAVVVAASEPAQPARPTEITVADVLAAEVAKASEAEVPAIMAAIEAKLSTMTVKDIKRVVEVAIRDKWYDRFIAVPGSKLYWILKIAQERAKQGKNVDELERSYYSTLKDWAKEEE